jgi:hypothetical protein
MVSFAIKKHGCSMRRACRLLQIHWNSYYYQPRPDRNVEIRKRLKELADQRRRFGCRRCMSCSKEKDMRLTTSAQNAYIEKKD